MVRYEPPKQARTSAYHPLLTVVEGTLRRRKVARSRHSAHRTGVTSRWLPRPSLWIGYSRLDDHGRSGFSYAQLTFGAPFTLVAASPRRTDFARLPKQNRGR